MEAGERVRIPPVENSVSQSLARVGIEAEIGKGLAEPILSHPVEVELAALVVHSHPVAAGAKFLALPAPIAPHPDVEFALLLLLLAERTRLIQHIQAALLSVGKLVEGAMQACHGEIIRYYLFLIGI